MKDYSQDGESLIARHFINQISVNFKPESLNKSNLLLIEFGGSRGIDNSNFLGLAEEFSFGIVQIEGDKRRFRQCLSVMQSVIGGTAINAWVGVEVGINRLDSLLESNNFSIETVLGVSIDIDGDDALVFENLGFTPPFAIVEFNPTLPIEGRFRQPEGKQYGNNIGELISVANSIGMYPVAITRLNIMFVRNDFREIIPEPDFDTLVQSLKGIRYGFGYDGTLIRYSLNNENLTDEYYHHGWTNTIIKQPLPVYIRRFTQGPTARFTRFFISLTLIAFRPISTLRFLVNKFIAPRNFN